MSTITDPESAASESEPSPVHLRVGDVDVRVVTDGGLDYSLDFLFPSAPEAELQLELDGRLDAAGQLRLPYDCLLLSTPGGTVLLDTGFQIAGPPAGRLLDSLAAVGVSPGIIGTVVLTHAHPDHIGGLLNDGSLVFPNARHVMTRIEWDAWSSEEILAKVPSFLAETAHAVLPVLESAGVLDLTTGETEIAPGIFLVPTPGHTLGHAAVAIRSGAEQVLFLADALVDELHFAHPEWTAGVDMEPDVTVSTRRRLLDEAVADSIPLLGYHLSGIGHAERRGDAFQFVR